MADGPFRPGRSPLVGRDDEFNRVQAALDLVMGGEGRMLLISGEPGIGKTRLVEELAALAVDQGAVVAWGGVDDEDGAPPYWPWVQLLDGILDGVDEQVLRDALDENAGPISAILPRVKEWVAEIPPPPLLDAAAARFHLHQAVVDFLRRVCVRRQLVLVLVLDNMHWADVASLELSRFLAARLNAVPVLFVFTHRSVDAGNSESLNDVLGSLARAPRLERIALNGLSPADVGRFMAQTIGLRSRPAVVTTVHARTEGNPFFVGELVRLLHSEGLLAAPGGPGQAAVPVGVRDVVQRRLARLPRPTHELLVFGAVVGREFDLAVLAAVAEMGEGDVADVIEPAIVAGVVDEATGVMGRFRFSHALIRDTIYGELSAVRRATLHARVGAALEARQGDARSHRAELAGHFFHAAPIVGPERGLDYMLEAAQAAQTALAFEQAEDDLRRALTLCDLLPTGRHRLEREIAVQNRLAMLLTTTRGYGVSETADAWTRSRQLYTELGDAREMLMPLFGLFLVHSTRADHKSAAAIGQQLLDLGAAVGDPALLLAGHEISGVTHLYRGHLGDARHHLEQSAALSASFDDVALLNIFPMHPGVMRVELAIVCHLTGDEFGCQEVRGDAKAVRDRLTHPLSVGPGLVLDLWLQGCEAAIESLPGDAARASQRCREWGLLELAAMADFWGAAALQKRDGSDRTADLTDALLMLEKSGFRILRTQYLAMLADSYRQTGDTEQALRLIVEGLAEADRNDERFWEPELLRLRAELLSASDPTRIQEAVLSVNQAIELARNQGSTTLERRAQATLDALEPSVAQTAPRLDPAAEVGALSPRERELLGLVGRGLTDKQIAADLVISLATVHSHLDRIRDKTGQRRRAELTRLAVDLGLVSG